MLSPIGCKERLLALGAKEEDLEAMMQDVQKIIYGKIFSELAVKLTPELQAALTGKKPEELEAYLKEHPDALPGLTTIRLQEITDQTWQQYFTQLEHPPVS